MLFRRGLRFSSRLHILMGLLSYASSPLWLVSIVLTTFVAFWGKSAEDAPPTAHLWQQTSFKSGMLFAYVLSLLLLPKFLAIWNLHRRWPDLRPFGGRLKVLGSVLMEIVFSMLLAPILMVFYTRFVISSLTGLQVKWGQQKRGEERPTWRELISLNGSMTLSALLAWALLAKFVPSLVPWLLPVLVGLVLSIPFARLTSSTSLGERARRKNWFLIPEEVKPPIELMHLDEPFLTGQGAFFEQKEYATQFGLLQAVLDPYVHAIHVSLLRLREQVSEKVREYAEELYSKLLAQGPGSLTPEERTNLLWDADALITMHRRLWVCPSGQLDPWWENALRHYNESTALETRRSVAATK